MPENVHQQYCLSKRDLPGKISLSEFSQLEKILMKEKLSALLTGNKQTFEDILIHQFEWMTLEQVLIPLF